MTLTRADLGIWLINLDRDTARRAAMEAQLTALGLSFTRFPAIYGKDHLDTLSKRADAGAYARNMGSAILPGKMGCYASHVAVWETFLASDHKVALILEDDVVFHDDFLQSLDLALAHADRWDTLRFNCIRAKQSDPRGIACGKIGLEHMIKDAGAGLANMQIPKAQLGTDLRVSGICIKQKVKRRGKAGPVRP